MVYFFQQLCLWLKNLWQGCLSLPFGDEGFTIGGLLIGVFVVSFVVTMLSFLLFGGSDD